MSLQLGLRALAKRSQSLKQLPSPFIRHGGGGRPLPTQREGYVTAHYAATPD